MGHPYDGRREVGAHNYREGSGCRRAIIPAEFVIGCPLILGLAVFLLVRGSWLFGSWVLGVAVNYVPLAVYAIQLSQRDALDREMAAVNVAAESRRAGVAQLMLLVQLCGGPRRGDKGSCS